VVAVVLVLVLGLCLGAAPASAGQRSRPEAGLARALRAVLHAGVLGAAAVRRGPDRMHLVTVGVRQRGHRRPIGLHDSFRIASVTKTFGAVLVAQLAGEGRLRLGDKVSRWLPGLLSHGDEITIGQLLQHTSGLPDYLLDPDFVPAASSDLLRRWTPRELLAYVATDPLLFRPGSRYHYSDSDNIVIGLIVERVTRRSFARALRQRIFRPLRLRDSFLPTGTALGNPFVHGYQYENLNGRGPLVDFSRTISPTFAWASGAIVSTLADLSRFWTGLFGGRLVKQRLLRRMTTHLVAGGGQPLGPGRNRSGLGIFAWRTRCGTLFGHTGNFPGYQLLSGATPNGRAAIVVLANTTGTSERAQRLQTAAYRRAACQAIRAAR
jgi:D-alanyl-D-alanine carboxypeptidase